MMLGAHGHLAGHHHLPSTNPGHYFYPYPPLTTSLLPAQEMVYPHMTGPHYPEVDSSDSTTSADASSSSQVGQLLWDYRIIGVQDKQWTVKKHVNIAYIIYIAPLEDLIKVLADLSIFSVVSV